MNTNSQITLKRLTKPLLSHWLPLCTGFLILSITGCTKEQVYETIKNSKQLECESAPPDEYRECMRAVSDTYKDYQRKKKEAEAESEEEPETEKKEDKK